MEIAPEVSGATDRYPRNPNPRSQVPDNQETKLNCWKWWGTDSHTIFKGSFELEREHCQQSRKFQAGSFECKVHCNSAPDIIFVATGGRVIFSSSFLQQTTQIMNKIYTSSHTLQNSFANCAISGQIYTYCVKVFVLLLPKVCMYWLNLHITAVMSGKN